MASPIEFISKDALFILIFLIPGYIGLHTLLLFFRTFFKAFKYRPKNISLLAKLIISIMWSSFTFALLFNIGNFEQMLSNLNVENMVVMIIVSILLAEGVSIFLYLIFFLPNAIISLLRFIFNKNPGRTQYGYWSKKRFKKIWEEFNMHSILSDLRYFTLIEAWQKGKKVILVLKDDKKIKGKLLKEQGKLPLRIDTFKIKSEEGIYVLSLDDIRYVIVPKQS